MAQMTLKDLKNTSNQMTLEDLKKKKKKETFKEKMIRLSNERYAKNPPKRITGEQVLDTVGGGLTSVGEGFLRTVEQSVDFGRYRVADVADVMGKGDYASQVRKNAQFDTTGYLLAPARKTYDKNAIKPGSIPDSILQGIGQIGAIYAGAKLLPAPLKTVSVGKLAMPTTAIVSGAGRGETTARDMGAKGLPAYAYAGGSGLLSGATEGLFGMFGSSGIDDAMVDVLTKKLTKDTSKYVVEALVKAGFEGIEEIIEGFLEPYLKRATIDKDAPLYTVKDAIQDFFVGATVGGIFQGGSAFNNVMAGTPYKSSVQVQQEKKLAELKAQDTSKMTETEKKKIDNEIKQIETKLPTADTEIRKEILPVADNVIKKEVVGKPQTLEESINKYFDTKNPQTIQLQDNLQKISENRNLNVLFDEDIKGNGLIEIDEMGNRTIKLNPNSDRALEFTLVHELVHDFEGTAEYESLRQAVQEFDSKNAGYEQARANLEAIYIEYYQKNGLDVSKLNIDSEATADVLGKVLGNQEFVNRLSIEKPSTFQKVLKWINNQIELLKSDNKEQTRFLQDIKTKFEEAYRQNAVRQEASVRDGYSNQIDYEKVGKEKQIVHTTNALEDILNVGVIKGEVTSVAVQNKNQKIVPYGTQAIIFKPEVLQYANLSKLFKGDGAYLRDGISKENPNKFGSINEMLADNPKFYNETTFNSDIPLNMIKEVRITDNTPKEIIDRLKKLDIEVKTYKLPENSNVPIKPKQVNIDKKSDTKYSINESKPKEQPYKKFAKEFLNNKNIKKSNINEGDYFLVDESGMKKTLVTLKVIGEDIIYIDRISAIDSGKGNASKLLTEIINIADKSGTKLMLEPNPKFDGAPIKGLKTLNKKELTDWYKRKGFFAIENGLMVYEPAVSKDSTGKTLSKQTAEYFKDSKVRDDKGRLLVMYHGTPNGDFSEFKDGGYFTPNVEYANQYQNPEASSISYGKTKTNPKTYEVYLDIKNPFDIKNKKVRDIYYEEYIKGGNSNFYDPYTSKKDIDNLDGIDWLEAEYLKEWVLENHPEYDGMVIDEGGTGGFGVEYKSRGMSYLPFNSNQIKAVDNIAPTKDPDIRYSVSEDKNLVAVHNLGQEKLEGILELGGIPVPSIAITKADMIGHDQFGDISLVFDKETINPTNRLNEVFDRDVWSPTFPRVEYEINDSKLQKIKSEVYYNYNDSISSDAISRYFTQDNLEDSINRAGIKRVIEDIKTNRSMKYVYQKTIDKSFEPIMKAKQFSDYFSNETLNDFLNNYKGKPLNELSTEETMALKDTILKSIEKELRLEFGDSNLDFFLKDYGNFSTLNKFIYNANQFKNYQTKTGNMKPLEIDQTKTFEKVDKAINQKAFEKWVDDTFGDIVANKGIVNDKDIFTPSGNRRSFKQLHDAYNLDNIIKNMTKQKTQGGQGGMFSGGFGSTSANIAQQFKSIPEIKANQNRLIPSADVEKTVAPIKEKLRKDMDKLLDYYKGKKDSFDAFDSINEVVFDFSAKALNESNFRKSLSEYYFDADKVPSKVMQNIITDLNKLKNVPTDYFESKPQRAVGLNEVKAVLVPNTIDADFKQKLIDTGLEVLEYNKSIDGDRKRVLNQLDNLKFSQSKQGKWQERLDTVYNFNVKEGTMLGNIRLDGKQAQILSERPKQLDKSVPSKLQQAIQLTVNKGFYVDKLAKATGNKELTFKYDKMLSAMAEGHYVIGVAQTDNNGKKIGKSINEIWKPVEDSGKTQEFSDYLLHKHNIDRMAQGKPVFSEDVTADISREIVKNYESTNPEFVELAQDINTFNKNQLQNMVDGGLTSVETQELLNNMYDNYVRIQRDIKGTAPISSRNGKIKVNSPIKKATGGNQDILPLKDSMASQAIEIKNAIRRNDFGLELYKTIGGEKAKDFDIKKLLDNIDGNYTLTVFDKGQPVRITIDEGLYNSISNDLKNSIMNMEKGLSVVTQPLQKVSRLQRSLLTVDNPLFVVTNFFKDFQDGMFNSKYPKKFIPNYIEAMKQIKTNGEIWQLYQSNGGMQNTYFDYNKGVIKQEAKGVKKFIEKIRNANEIVEQAPRVAEFISTIQDGKSITEAMYNASEVTTNFKRGGDLTKALNKNGANFLNASVQGFEKQIRNITGANGFKGYANLMLKATMLGVLPAVLNHMLLEDDEEYEDLPDYAKDNFFLFKVGDGKFVRIPKGRVLSVFGSSARRILELADGEEDAFDGFLTNAQNQVAPNNPLQDNIIAPIVNAIDNKTWFGGDLVPQRLQNELPKNQWDEKTDAFSKWLGEKLNVSPIKINYMLDQYSGGLGDVLLPLTTPRAEQNPLSAKFSIDSIMSNRNVQDFFRMKERLTQIANDRNATDEEKLMVKFLNREQAKANSLYAEKREIELSDMKDKEKTKAVREIQSQINSIMENALETYENVDLSGNYARVGDYEWYRKDGEWESVSSSQQDKNSDLDKLDFDKNDYYSNYTKLNSIRYNDTLDNDTKRSQIIDNILKSDLSSEQKLFMYNNYYASDEKINAITKAGIEAELYLQLEKNIIGLSADDDPKSNIEGKTVSGSKKAKIVAEIQKLPTTRANKMVLYGMQGYALTPSEKTEVFGYINNLRLSIEDKKIIIKQIKSFQWLENGNLRGW